MKIKQIDRLLDISLWVIFLLCVLLSWKISKKITAPDYELAESDYSEQYTYETEDGERITSTYYLAWYHKKCYIHPDLVVYDPSNGKVQYFKPEYIEKYKAMASESNYTGLWRHIFWVWFIGLSLVCATIIVVFGQDLRDKILVCILRGRKDQFLELTYFMYNTGRCSSARSEVQAMLPAAAKQYVLENRYNLSRKFNEKFYNVLIGWLNVIVRTGSTTIPYTYKFENKLIQMQPHLDYCINYWDKQRGIIPNADNIIKQLRDMKSKNFMEIPTITENDSYKTSVTDQLKKMFTEIMGSEVFTFQADLGYLAEIDALRRGERVVVKTVLYNDEYNTFTWSGTSCKGMTIPGIRVFFTVDIINGNEVTNLWKGYLPPVCNYSTKDDNFSALDLYNNMITHTIDTFVSTMKKA